MQWIVAPVAGFVFLIYRTQQDHATKLAVLSAVHDANKEAYDREFKEMRESHQRDKEEIIQTIQNDISALRYDISAKEAQINELKLKEYIAKIALNIFSGHIRQ
jgi:Na+-translocating ferredoxin:NAD+ oxidoreductase RnfC subunit